MSTMEKISEYDLSTIDKVTHRTIGIILKPQNQIAAILTDYTCGDTYSGAYGNDLLIHSEAVWLTKDGITAAATINKLVKFTGTTYASCYA